MITASPKGIAGDPPRLHVVSVGRNTERWVERYFDGLLSQRYPFWRATWVDDASTDASVELAWHMTDGDERVEIVANAERRFAMANQLHAIGPSDLDEIIVLWDADDFFAGPHVLERIAEEYEDPACWLTYGSHAMWPSMRAQFPREPYPDDADYRRHPFICAQPRTFRRRLFEHLRRDDVVDHHTERTPMTSSDKMLMIPMLEMAGPEHARFIPDVLYLWNQHDHNNHNLWPSHQMAVSRRCVLERPRKQRLATL